MPFIDTPKPNGDHKVDLTAKESLCFNNELLKNNWLIDVGLDSISNPQLSNANVIKQAVLNLLLTMRGERLFNLQFGTNIFAYLFENEVRIGSIKNDIVAAVKRYEHRIRLSADDIEIFPNPDQHYIEINLVYYIKASQEIGQLKEKLYV